MVLPPQDYTYIAGTGGPNAPVISPSGGTFKEKGKGRHRGFNPVRHDPLYDEQHEHSSADPTISSTPYTESFKLTGKGTKIVKAKAFRDTDGGESPVARVTFKIK